MKENKIKKDTLEQNKIIDYVGSKEKLFPWIFEKISFEMDLQNSNIKFFDLFAGTTVFSKMLYEKVSWQMGLNDYQLFSPQIAHYIDSSIEETRLITLLKTLDELPLIENGIIFQELGFGGKPKSITDYEKVFTLPHEQKCRGFFSEKVSKKLDTIKTKIKEWFVNKEITENEKNILLLFLISYADRNANTTSVYGAYLKELKMLKEIPFYNEKTVQQMVKPKNRIIEKHNLDVLDCLNQLEQGYDIIYMDPPYNTRDYYTLYHILNYVIDLDFDIKMIKENSKTAVPAERKENIFSSARTYKTMREIINIASLKSNKIFISYNNESCLSKEQFISIFEEFNLHYIFHTKEHQKYISRTDRDYDNNTKVEEWLIEVYR